MLTENLDSVLFSLFMWFVCLSRGLPPLVDTATVSFAVVSTATLIGLSIIQSFGHFFSNDYKSFSWLSNQPNHKYIFIVHMLLFTSMQNTD